MPFKKRLSKYLKNTVYKYSLASKPAENGYYMLYSSTSAPVRCNNNNKPTIIPRTSKNT